MDAGEDVTEVEAGKAEAGEVEAEGELTGDGAPTDRRERMERLREAAIQAEYATGRQEETEAQARRNVILRLGTITVGFIVLIGGFAMMVLPGPGILGILAGLGILSRELPWAERMMESVQKRAKLDELKEQPKWVQVVMWIFTALAVGASLWWTFLADPRPRLSQALPWNW